MMNKLHFLSVSFPDFTLPLNDPVLVFSLVLFIILLAPLVLSRLRIPGIVGLIVAGVIIGPNGFNILARNEGIVLFGTVGLLYIMFLAGLELDLTEFKKYRHRSILFGGFTFFIPSLLGFPVCYYLLGYDLTASLLISSMFATHTLVAYPIVSRLGVARNEAVAITVGGTIITDTAVLILLSVITSSAEGELNQEFWIRLIVSVVAFAAIVLLLIPPMARWFFKNIEGEKTSQYIYVLAMVFLAAFLAKLAGLEPIVGAFLAGLALNRLIPHTSPLMNRVEFVGNALFIPFFLISVGMLVDMRVLLKGPQALLVAASLTTTAIAGKWLAALFTQKAFGYHPHQRQLIFGLSNSHAAATLAVILIGYNLKILDENVLNGTIVLILITCLVASFVTEGAAKKIALEESITKIKLHDTEEKILVPISNPSTIETMMDFAILVKEQESKQPISALAIVQDDDEAREKVVMSNKMLEHAIVHASATDTKVHILSRVDLNIASGISRAIKEMRITTVIIGWSEQARPIGKIFGTTLDNLLESASQMIMVCRILLPINLVKRIVVAAPENADAERGFELWVQKIVRLARQTGSPVHLYSFNRTADAFKEVLKKMKSPVTIYCYELDFLYKFLALEKEVQEEDVFIVISARKGTISYSSNLDEIPGKLEKSFQKHNFIIIYPEQIPVAPVEKIITPEDFIISPS
ncbi:MAG: cation:proton antiporter [Chitinophagales bacterium]|nr:cation:proton antiporter [Chitinophagales bacterium]